MTDLLKEIEAQMKQFCINVNAHAIKGNKTAGVRARKASLKLEKLLKEYRKVSIEADKQ